VPITSGQRSEKAVQMEPERLDKRICEADALKSGLSKRPREWQMVRAKMGTTMGWYVEDGVNQEEIIDLWWRCRWSSKSNDWWGV